MKKRILSLVASAASLFCFSNGANAQKTEKLFNRKNLSNWNLAVDKNSVPADQVYSIHDGKISITGQPFGYMYIKEKYSDYKLHMEWRWSNGDSNANSGTLLYIADLKNPFPNGIECNLQTGRVRLLVLPGGSDLVKCQQRLGEERLFFLVVKNMNPSSEKPTGEWNEASIPVKDGVITVCTNDVYQNTGTNKVEEGRIESQSEGKEAEFRDVTLTRWWAEPFPAHL